MADLPASAAPAPMPARPTRFELAIVALLALALLLPGVWRYSLTDPWETHYAEVGRRMLADHDWVHTEWQQEGFRSKPVLTFWLMAASMKALGVADDGGYSGEMTSSDTVVLAIRLPFVLFGALGLFMIWWMLARLWSRRAAYLAFGVIGAAPFYALVARQGITDITLLGSMMGAIALFALANEAGDTRLRALAQLPLPWRSDRRRFAIDGRHLVLGLIGLFVGAQALYYLWYFASGKPVAAGMRFPAPGLVIPLIAVVPLILTWARPAQFAFGDPDRLNVWWVRLLSLRRLTDERQVYMLGAYAFLGVSILGKGIPALGIFGVVAFFYVLLLGRWRSIWNGHYEIKRGLLILIAMTVPWHLAMFVVDGPRFISEYFVTHLFRRAAVGVFGDRGTFNYYLTQLGYGLFVWAGLALPALVATLRLARRDTVQGRLRFLVVIWATTTVAFFALVQTKFHHYILPAVPAVGICVALWLDDIGARRTRVSWAALGVAIAVVLLLTRDLMHEEGLWIEMFVFRYDRPWPGAAPWSIDTTDGFLALGLGAVAAFLLLGLTRRRAPWLGISAVMAAGLVAGLWAMHVYMPIAGQHWGMRDAMALYYRDRQIHGVIDVAFAPSQLQARWQPRVQALRAGQPVRVRVESVIPDALLVGQPATVRVVLQDPRNQRATLGQTTVRGTLVAIEDHAYQVEVAADAADAIDEFLRAHPAGAAQDGRPPRAATVMVDADRLFAWQAYWRGEVFWSGDEIWGLLPEQRTDWQMDDSDSKKFAKYLGDPVMAPRGRRYYLITQGSAMGAKASIPTPRGKETLEVLSRDSNKFQLGRFEL